MASVSPLGEKIRDRIEQAGPLSCREFMEIALYDPVQGYYARCCEIGPDEDFYTSSNIHPLFGEMLAEKFTHLWASMGGLLILVEVGAGTGQLAEDILKYFERQSPEIYRDLTYIISETSPALRTVQQERLDRFSSIVQWMSLHELIGAAIKGIVFSNELIDALPVHRVIFLDGRFRELLVGCRGERLVWVPGEFTSEGLKEFVSRWGVEFEDGQIGEVNLNAVEYLEQVSSILDRGYVVTVDYGELRSSLYRPERRDGTLRGYHRHQVTDNIFDRIGEQDLTSSVDFTLLIEEGARVGLETIEFKTQRQFLVEQGLLERLSRLSDQEENERDRMKSLLAAKHFLMPGAFGDHFKVLIQRKRCA